MNNLSTQSHNKPGQARSYFFRLLFIVLTDIAITFGVPLFSLYMTFDFNKALFSYLQKDTLLQIAPFFCAMAVALYYITHLYSVIWSYVSSDVFFRVLLVDGLLMALQYSFICMTGVVYPPNFYLLEFLLFVALTTINRFFYRFAVGVYKRTLGKKEGVRRSRRALLIGAGEAGHVLLKESKTDASLGLKFVAAIDDNVVKQKRYIEGVRVVGGREDIVAAAARFRVEVIVLAIPSAMQSEKQKILDICKRARVPLLIMPSVSQMVNGEDDESAETLSHELREIRMEDLLGREPVKVNTWELSADIGDRTVLITGAGGSIGSELSRQIASFSPRRLILFDIYENGVYDVQMELERAYPNLNLTVLIGSIRDEHRLEDVFTRWQPELVYHAAAHKHVPLMEASPNEVIKNNVQGTLLMAEAAARHGAKRFVMISTDKAVNPTNIMGASKRLCEMIVQDMNRSSPNTDFVAVRFGNVLGSNGSVIPLFRKQIQEGGPVTVTDPDIVRYFMTIPEAVNLVLQAGYYAHGGEIFVLDMGEPVKILDLAKNLIYLSGLEPGKDIKIIFSGLRPGEKLYEEMLMKSEGLQKTPNRKIFVGQPLDFDHDIFQTRLKTLIEQSYLDGDGIRAALAEIVPTYHFQMQAEEMGSDSESARFAKEIG